MPSPVSSSLPAQKERQGLFEPGLCFPKIGSASQDNVPNPPDGL
jgi:hypothetical protein